jgi:hypothetical protein
MAGAIVSAISPPSNDKARRHTDTGTGRCRSRPGPCPIDEFVVLPADRGGHVVVEELQEGVALAAGHPGDLVHQGT